MTSSDQRRLEPHCPGCNKSLDYPTVSILSKIIYQSPKDTDSVCYVYLCQQCSFTNDDEVKGLVLESIINAKIFRAKYPDSKITPTEDE